MQPGFARTSLLLASRYMRPDLEPPPGLQDKEDARKRAIKEVLTSVAGSLNRFFEYGLLLECS